MTRCFSSVYLGFVGVVGIDAGSGLVRIVRIILPDSKYPNLMMRPGAESRWPNGTARNGVDLRLEGDDKVGAAEEVSGD